MSKSNKTISTNIESLLTASVQECFLVVESVLKSKKIPFLYGENFLVTDVQSKKPIPLICVHLDTLSRVMPKANDIVNTDGVITLKKGSKSICLGADDRAGLWIALKMIEQGTKTKFNFGFFDLEESGGKGSSEFADTYPYFEASCLIGLDRADKKAPNVATYGYDNQEIINLFKDFGYVEGSGTFSDCSNLAMFMSVPCVNVSVGYSSEHSVFETLSVSSMNRTLEVMKEVEIPEKEYEVEMKEDIYDWKNWRYDFPSDEGLRYSPVVCDDCGDHAPLYSHGYLQVCENCLVMRGVI